MPRADRMEQAGSVLAVLLMAPSTGPRSTDLATDCAIVIADLWSDERCVWHIDFEGSAGTSDPWTVVLEWTQEYDTQHGAEWSTHTWLFYGATPAEVLTEASAWCQELEPWRRCPECDGCGEWNGERCADCDGTGLAS